MLDDMNLISLFQYYLITVSNLFKYFVIIFIITGISDYNSEIYIQM